jgi:hypothetical protein
MSRSLTQLPNNTNTSQTAEVYSATGFSAGDLVYYQGGDYKPAGSLTTSNSVTFENVANLNTSTLLNRATTGTVFPTTVGTPTGSSGGRFADVLTNGNIVQAFYNTGPTPGGGTAGGVYFRIVNTSGVVQVAPTQIGSDVPTNKYCMEVVALTGGGFVVVYINGTQISYAIYTNTGSLTTAVTRDTGAIPSSSYRIRATKLANGGFAIGVQDNSTGTMKVRSYGATGTAAYAWANTGVGIRNSRASFGLSSRSNNYVIISFVQSGVDNINYFVFDTSGSIAVYNTFAITANNAYIPVDVTCLADGTTFVISYFTQTSPNLACFRLLPSSNTLGSQIAIPSANINSGNNNTNGNYTTSVLALSSGGFAMVFADYFNTLNYAFFNSSGTAVSGTNGSGTLPISIPSARSAIDYNVTLLEISGFVNMYWTTGVYTQSESNPNQSFAQINSTTYQLVPRTSTVSGIMGSATVAAGNAVVASATPANTKFFPATTSSGSYSQAFGATVVSPSTVSSSACYSIASCTLPNGQFVIVYHLQASPYTVFANVYSSAGALLTTINLGAGSSIMASVKVSALSSGKFVIGWVNSANNQFNLNLYSSTFTQIGSTQTVQLYTTYGPLSWAFDIAGLGNNSDRYVVAYNDNSGWPSYAVYDNTNTRIVGPTYIIQNTSYFNCKVAADPFGGFGISNGTGASSHLTVYIQTGTTTYSLTSNFLNSFSGMVGGNYQSNIIYGNNGYYQAVSYGSSANVFHAPTNQTDTTNQTSGNIPNAYYGTTNSITQNFGLDGNGNLIFITMVDNVNSNLFVLFGSVSFSGNSSAVTSYPTNRNLTFPLATNTSNYAQYSISPSTGSNFVLAWLGPSNVPYFAIYNSLALSGTFPITAGVTTSGTIAISPLASTSSSVAPNTVLAGVAVTGATAGSTGQVAINGLAQLNSNYPSGTNQAFDFTGQVIDGVKGVINGRTVNMQGNS